MGARCTFTSSLPSSSTSSSSWSTSTRCGYERGVERCLSAAWRGTLPWPSTGGGTAPCWRGRRAPGWWSGGPGGPPPPPPLTPAPCLSRIPDSATYTCLVTNPYGRANRSLHLRVQDVPEAIPHMEVPAQPLIMVTTNSCQVIDYTGRTANLSWTAPYSGNAAITVYNIQYKTYRYLKTWKCQGHQGSYLDISRLNKSLCKLFPFTLYRRHVVSPLQGLLGVGGQGDRLRLRHPGRPRRTHAQHPGQHLLLPLHLFLLFPPLLPFHLLLHLHHLLPFFLLLNLPLPSPSLSAYSFSPCPPSSTPFG